MNVDETFLMLPKGSWDGIMKTVVALGAMSWLAMPVMFSLCWHGYIGCFYTFVAAELSLTCEVPLVVRTVSANHLEETRPAKIVVSSGVSKSGESSRLQIGECSLRSSPWLTKFWRCSVFEAVDPD